MAEIDSAVQEQLDEFGERLDDAVRRVNLIALGGHNSNPQPAPSHNSEAAATVLAIDEQTKELRRLRQELVSLPTRIADELDNRFAIDEELDDEQPPRSVKKKSGAKGDDAGAKGDNAGAGEDEQQQRRRGYF